MSWKHGIQSSRRTDSLIGLIGLFALLAIGVALQKQPSAAETAPAVAGGGQDAAAVRREHRAIDQAREAIAAPAKSAPAKKTDEEIAAWVISSVIAYDHSCETLPEVIMRRIYSGLDVVPLAIFTAATEEAGKTYHQIGRVNYCKITKPLITKILARAP
jgi:hypothetical protein